MLELLGVVLISGIVVFFMNKVQKQKEADAEAVFRATMLSLEDKAKREGTFVRSYFDESDKK